MIISIFARMSKVPLHSKSELIDVLLLQAKSKVSAAEEMLRSLSDSRNGETKSSAGDKHETSRAMVQHELDQVQTQLESAKSLLHEMEQCIFTSPKDAAGMGSLVITSAGNFILCAALGKLNHNGSIFFAISSHSPMAKALAGNRAGDIVQVQGINVRIDAIL